MLADFMLFCLCYYVKYYELLLFNNWNNIGYLNIAFLVDRKGKCTSCFSAYLSMASEIESHFPSDFRKFGFRVTNSIGQVSFKQFCEISLFRREEVKPENVRHFY